MASQNQIQVAACKPDDITKHLNIFLRTSKHDKNAAGSKVVLAGLYLLQQLPSARSAVLDHLCNVFDDAVNTHIIKLETDSSVSEPIVTEFDPILNDIYEVLTNLVHSHPEVWAPIISAWSIELLGHISSKYAGRRAVPHSNNLNEVLQLWMTCHSTKTLIEVASECFASMVDNTPDVSVDALLEASAKHSTDFDWVVAHIGSCFPKTVITRVLSSSFKDFKDSNPEQWIGPSDRNSKLSSAVGILGHLAAQHSKDIKESLIKLFSDGLKLNNESAKGKPKVELRVAPFLLCLSEKSSMLLATLSSELTIILTPEVLNRLADSFTRDKGKTVPNTDTLLSLIVHLITRSQDCALQVLKFLVGISAPSEGSEDGADGEEPLRAVVQSTAAVIVNRLITDLQRVVNARCSDTALEIPFLQALKPHSVYLSKIMLTSSYNAARWYSQILTCLALYTDENTATEIVTSIALYATSADQLSIWVQIIRAIESKYVDIVDSFLQRSIGMLESVQKGDTMKVQLLRNIATLVSWEKADCDYHFVLKRNVQTHIETLGSNLLTTDGEVAIIIIDLFSKVGFPTNFDIGPHMKLCSTVVYCMFQVLWDKDITTKTKSSAVCRRYLEQLCAVSPGAQTAVLKHLLTGAVSTHNCKLFGGKCDEISSMLASVNLDQIAPVLKVENSNPRLASKPGIFHAGVIGSGLKLTKGGSALGPEEVMTNKQLLLRAVKLACRDYHGKLLTESDVLQVEEVMEEESAFTVGVASTISSILVDMVTPDVMYNKMDWPEDDFIKVTIERDLQIKKQFNNNPVLWDVMDFVAAGDGAMWVCAPILRGLLGTLVAHWESCRDKSTRNSPWYLNASCSVIGWMRQGGLLAPPLAYTGEILHLIAPYEAYLILLNIWRYMHQEKPPAAPSTRARRKTHPCDLAHMVEILPILHKNIDKLGHLYARFYVPEHAEKYKKLVSNTFSSITVE